MRTKNNIKINFGCGQKREAGYVNVDKFGDCDIFLDLNKFPYPFNDNTASEIKMMDILEHLTQPMDSIIECYRILKNDGKLIISVPYMNSISEGCKIDHKKGFMAIAFKDLKQTNTDNKNKEVVFKEINVKIIFPKGVHIINYFLEPFANLFQDFYENSILRILFPARQLYIELIK